MNMFARNAAKLALTPWERGLLQLLQGIVISAALAGLVAAFPYLSGTTPDYQTALHTFAVAGLTSLVAAVVHALKAYGDPSLPSPAPGAVPIPPAPPPAA